MQAVEDGHHHVEDDEVWQESLGGLDRLSAVLRRLNLVVLPFEPALDEREVHRLVVGYEYDGRAGVSLRRGAPLLFTQFRFHKSGTSAPPARAGSAASRLRRGLLLGAG